MDQSSLKHLLGRCSAALLAVSPLAKLYALGVLESTRSASVQLAPTSGTPDLPACLRLAPLLAAVQSGSSSAALPSASMAAWLGSRVRHAHALIALQRPASSSSLSGHGLSELQQQQQTLYRHDAATMLAALAHLFKDLHAGAHFCRVDYTWRPPA